MPGMSLLDFPSVAKADALDILMTGNRRSGLDGFSADSWVSGIVETPLTMAAPVRTLTELLWS